MYELGKNCKHKEKTRQFEISNTVSWKNEKSEILKFLASIGPNYQKRVFFFKNKNKSRND